MRKIGWLVLMLFASPVFADISVYTIDGKIEAAFPKQPQLIGELGEGRQKHRSYQVTDDNNLIFAVTYQLGKTRFKRKDIAEAISLYVKGNALSVGGRIQSQRAVKIGGNEGTYYVVEYELQGIPVQKFGAVIYRDGQFYSWTVQELKGVTKGSAANVFREHARHFSVK